MKNYQVQIGARNWGVVKVFLCALSSVVIARGAEAKIGEHNLTIPDGFEIELVAGPPLTERPVVADFDDQGRLYVAESSGSNDNVQKQLQERPHSIIRLEDSNGDGKFDKRVVFADKMMFTEGTMWHDGSLYASAPPSIWKLTDSDGDGVADKREEWLDAKTLTGCANDLHGPYLGPDGWIYWCKGAFAEQSYERPGKEPFKTRAAHIFRRRPEGGPIEAVMTGGMDNPVDVVFTPEGERIFTTTFFQHPGGGQRDGLIHAIYGGVYGKVHDVIEGHKRTGEIMPVLTHLGPAAPSGLARLESMAWGEDYENNLLACNFNLRKVTRHKLQPKGATFESSNSDFVLSDNSDFHPTDVIEDADGSVLVINTGGWYKLCCPTSQLYKPDVLGGIYRVKRKGAAVVDARGSNLKWDVSPEELTARLLDKRPAVRRKATAFLARSGAAGVKAISDYILKGSALLGNTNGLQLGGSVKRDTAAVWALTQIDLPEARIAVRAVLRDPASDTARQAALHSISVWRDRGGYKNVLDILQDPNPHVKRAAAEALGRLENRAAVPALLKAAESLDKSAPDRVLEHSLIYALIEIADGQGTAAGLTASHAAVKRVALIALDQMENSPLRAEQVTPLLASGEPLVKDAALWVIRRHQDWGGQMLPYFSKELALVKGGGERGNLESLLTSFAKEERVQKFLGEELPRSGPWARIVILKAMGASGVKEVPEGWAEALASEADRPLDQLYVTVRSLPLKREKAERLARKLEITGELQTVSPETRLDALASVPGGARDVSPEVFRFVIERLDSNNFATRSKAAAAAAKMKLNEEQLLQLAYHVRSVGPVELPQLLAAFETSTNSAVGQQLIGSLKVSGAIKWVSAEQLKKHLSKYPPEVKKAAEEAMAEANEDSAQQKENLEKILAELGGGDVRRGQAIFNSEKAACASCHAIGYLGGNLGPDLTRIGQIRNERDLLEAIVYPSASFVRSYESVIVVTKDEEQHSGVLRKDAPDEIVLATGPGVEVRIPRAQVVSTRPGAVSVMPQGLDQQLSKQEMADLVAFLKNTKW